MRTGTLGLIAGLVLTAVTADAQTYSSRRDTYTVEFDREMGLCTAGTDIVDVETGAPGGFTGAFVGPDGFLLVHGNSEWANLSDREVSVAFEFSNGQRFAGTGELASGALIFGPEPGDLERFIQSWAYSRQMVIRTTKGYTYPFELNGTAVAWGQLQKCWHEHFAQREQVDPFGGTSSTDPF